MEAKKGRPDTQANATQASSVFVRRRSRDTFHKKGSVPKYMEQGLFCSRSIVRDRYLLFARILLPLVIVNVFLLESYRMTRKYFVFVFSNFPSE